MNRLYLLPLAALIAGIGLISLSVLSHAESTAGTSKPALTVTTLQAAVTQLPVKLNATGNVVAWQEAEISSDIGGIRLVEVLVNVGEKVKKGQLLARFEAETVDADFAQQKAAVAEASANYEEARANAERARQLQASGALSAQQITQYLTAESSAKARLDATQAQLKNQQLRLKYTRLIAPDDGIISARTATVGSMASQGQALFRLIRQGKLEWHAELPAHELARVQAGQTARILTGTDAPVVATIRMVAPTVDPQTRLGLVYVDLPDSANHILKAGMFATGEFELGSSKALAVPQQAVVTRDGYSYLFQVKPDSHVSAIKVTLGRRMGNQIEIVSPLPPGTQLVGAGAGFLNDGDLVKVVAPTASPSPVTR